MQSYYYMNAAGMKDGPHDLVTIMRRINAGKIVASTWVFIGESSEAALAHQIDDLRGFFNQPKADIRQELVAKMHISIATALRHGIHFINEHQTMTVFAGAILLFSALFGILLNEIFGPYMAVVWGWVTFLILQGYYMVAALRTYRGQAISIDFIERNLSPIAGTLIASSMAFGLIVVGGLTLLIIPGIIALVIYAFVPFIIFDRGENIVQSAISARALLKKLDNESILKLAGMFIVYIALAALLLPIPFIMPIFAAALSSIYEDVSAS